MVGFRCSPNDHEYPTLDVAGRHLRRDVLNTSGLYVISHVDGDPVRQERFEHELVRRLDPDELTP